MEDLNEGLTEQEELVTEDEDEVCDFCGGSGEEYINEDTTRPCPKCSTKTSIDDDMDDDS